MDEGACDVNLKRPESFSPINLAPTAIDSTAVPKISPLQLAVYSGNIELISTLTSKADVNYQDQVGSIIFLFLNNICIYSIYTIYTPSYSLFTLHIPLLFNYRWVSLHYTTPLSGVIRTSYCYS